MKTHWELNCEAALFFEGAGTGERTLTNLCLVSPGRAETFDANGGDQKVL